MVILMNLNMMEWGKERSLLVKKKKNHRTIIINWIKQVGELLLNSYSPAENSPGGKIR